MTVRNIILRHPATGIQKWVPPIFNSRRSRWRFFSSSSKKKNLNYYIYDIIIASIKIWYARSLWKHDRWKLHFQHTLTHTFVCMCVYVWQFAFIRFSCSERLSILRRIALPKAGSDTKLLKLAMSGRFILASAPIRHIDASLKVIGGAFTSTDGRAGGRRRRSV